MKYFTKEELDFIANELVNNPSKETIKKLDDKYNGNSEEEKVNAPTWVENNPSFEPANINPIPIMNNNNENNVLSNNEFVPKEINTNKESVPNTPSYSSIYRPGYEPSNTPVWNPINNSDNNIYNSNLNSQNVTPEIPTSNLSNNGMSSIPNLNIQSEPFNANQNNNNQSVIPSFSIPNLSTPNIVTEQANNGNFGNNNINNTIQFQGNPWETQNSNYNSMMQTTDNFNNNIEPSSNLGTSIEPMPFFQPGINVQENQIPISEPPKEEGPTMLEQFEQNYNNNAA